MPTTVTDTQDATERPTRRGRTGGDVAPDLEPAAGWRRHLPAMVAFAATYLLHGVLLVAVGGFPRHDPYLWDAGYYRAILRHGYDPLARFGAWQQTNFFPLLSWLTRGVQLVVRSETAAVVIVTVAANLAALVLVAEVARRWRGERTARWTLALVCLFPVSLFLQLFFTEALFLALSAGAVLAAERRRWVLASVLGAGVVMTRTVGILVVAPLVAVRWQQRRRVDLGMLWPFVPVAGVLPVLVAQKLQSGDAYDFLRTSAAWGRRTVPPWQPLADGIWSVTHHDWPARYGVPFDLLAGLAFVALVVVAWRRPFPLAGRVWLTAMVLAPLCSGFLASLGRYMLAAWPGFILAADLVKRAPRWAQALVVLMCLALTVERFVVWHDAVFIG